MLRSKSVMVDSCTSSIDLHLFRHPIAAQNNEKKSSQLHGFACSSCSSSPAVFSKAFLVLFSSSSLLRHQRRLSSSAMTCFAKILSLCEKVSSCRNQQRSPHRLLRRTVATCSMDLLDVHLVAGLLSGAGSRKPSLLWRKKKMEAFQIVLVTNICFVPLAIG